MNHETLLMLFCLLTGLVLAWKQSSFYHRQPVLKAIKEGAILSAAYLVLDIVLLKNVNVGLREFGFAIIWIGEAIWLGVYLHHHRMDKDDEDWEAC